MPRYLGLVCGPLSCRASACSMVYGRLVWLVSGSRRAASPATTAAPPNTRAGREAWWRRPSRPTQGASIPPNLAIKVVKKAKAN